MTERPLTERQRQVLTAVRIATDVRALPAGEYAIYSAGYRAAFWGPLALHNHVRRLVDRGYLLREGTRGSYRYSLTDKGRAALRGES